MDDEHGIACSQKVGGSERWWKSNVLPCFPIS